MFAKPKFNIWHQCKTQQLLIKTVFSKKFYVSLIFKTLLGEQICLHTTIMKALCLLKWLARVSKPETMLSEKRFVKTHILSLKSDKQMKNVCAWDFAINLITPSSRWNWDFSLHAKTDVWITSRIPISFQIKQCIICACYYMIRAATAIYPGVQDRSKWSK